MDFLDKRNPFNYVYDTVYGVIRLLYDRIVAQNHILEHLVDVNEYLSNETLSVEKNMFKKANYKEYKTKMKSVDYECFDCLPRLYNKQTVIESLSAMAVGDVYSQENIIVEPFIDMVRVNNYEYIYPLPFYCLESINVLDSLFAMASSVLNINTSYISIYNEIFYEVEEEKNGAKFAFFSAVPNMDTYVRRKTACKLPPYRQLYMCTTNEYLLYVTLKYFFVKFRDSKFLEYRKVQPYELIEINHTGTEVREFEYTDPYFTQIQLSNKIKKEKYKHILLGQSIDKHVTHDMFIHWLQHRRLMSTCSWRSTLNQSGSAMINKLTMLCTLNSGKQLLHYDLTTSTNIENVFKQFFTSYLPPIIVLDQAPDSTTTIERIFQQICYIQSLQTTLITNYTLWPSKTINNIRLFRDYNQRTVNIDTIKQIFEENYNMIKLNHVVVYETNGITLHRINFDSMIIYSFSSDGGSAVFSLFDFLYNFLHEIKLKKIQNHSLLDNLLFLFDLTII